MLCSAGPDSCRAISAAAESLGPKFLAIIVSSSLSSLARPIKFCREVPRPRQPRQNRPLQTLTACGSATGPPLCHGIFRRSSVAAPPRRTQPASWGAWHSSHARAPKWSSPPGACFRNREAACHDGGWNALEVRVSRVYRGSYKMRVLQRV